MNKEKGSIAIVATEAMYSFAQRIHQRLDDRFTYVPVKTTVFANREFKPVITETVRKRHVYLIHALHPDPNTTYMSLFITMDALSRAAAESITLVLPYMPYLRQDRKDEKRSPITAKLMADLVQTNEQLEHIITMDMHAQQEQGFYRVPVDNLFGADIHKDYFAQQYGNDFSNVVVVSPDYGGANRARDFVRKLDADIPVYSIDKRRTGPNKAEMLHFVGGDIVGKDVILYDDMIDTGGSIIAGANVVLERGAKKVLHCVTHPVFSAHEGVTAESRFVKAGVQVIATETIQRPKEYHDAHADWLTILPIDALFAEAIRQSATVSGSVSSLSKRNGK